MAIAMAMAIVFRSCCNGDGATATAIDRLQWGNGNGATGAIAMALGHRSRGNRTVIAMAMGMGQRSIE
jgi:hypothetical protein